MPKLYIELERCKKGYLYKISSRNLRFGVYDGNQGFIGIREKFSSRYLFTEYHYDQGPPFGTVHPMIEVEQMPKDIELVEYFETIDKITSRPVKFDKSIDAGGQGWYFLDTLQASTEIVPISRENKPLFDYLDRWEKT
jgi:hypothetical protein